MLRGLYSAATGIDAATLAQETAAENLAHADVPGYRRRGLSFQTFEQTLAAVQPSPQPSANPVVGQVVENASNSLLGTQLAAAFTSTEAGPLQRTGNPLDVAATGNAWFVVDGPNGPLLTRNGTFQLTRDNRLQTTSGLNVRGEGGSITIPQDASEIVIGPDGAVLADGRLAGRLLVAVVPPGQQLVRAGTTLFQGAVPQGSPEPGTVRVEQGFREGSNVQAVMEMVSMISALRHLEANDRTLRTLGEAVGLATRPQG